MLEGVSFSVMAGEHVAIVGERGSGKSALLRAVTLLQKPEAGRIYFEGTDITRLGGSQMRALRQRLQFVGGNPMRTLPPEASVGETLLEPLRIHHRGSAGEQQAQVEAVITLLGLNALLLRRKVSALSAALRQRVALARAFALQPRLLVCDELTEHLDPAAAHPLLEIVARACRAGGLAWLWATSDRALAQAFANRVLHLTNGHLVAEAG